jgi:predicted double-glycine peptidase
LNSSSNNSSSKGVGSGSFKLAVCRKNREEIVIYAVVGVVTNNSAPCNYYIAQANSHFVIIRAIGQEKLLVTTPTTGEHKISPHSPKHFPAGSSK